MPANPPPPPEQFCVQTLYARICVPESEKEKLLKKMRELGLLPSS